MKKTVTVNLNGRVFTIDEDAYNLLENYLKNLRIYFRKEEGSSEIIADFEARIEELLSEKLRLGYEVITIEQVEEVITRVGKPTDFSDKEEVEEEEKENEKEKQTSYTEYKYTKKKFFRNMDDKMFGGICSGLSAYFGWDVLPIRLVFIILIFATSLWIVPVYLIFWIFFPGAYTAEQKLQMRGKPITVENIGKTVAAEVETPQVKKKGCLAGVIDLFVSLLKVVLVGLGCLVGLPLIFALMIVIIVLFAVVFGVGGGLLGLIPLGWIGSSAFLTVSHPALATVTFTIVLGIPIIALIYSLIAYLAKLKPLNKAVKWVFMGTWILALVIFLCSGFKINRDHWVDNIKWNWTISDDGILIEESGVLSEKEYLLTDAIDYVEVSENLVATLQIEQNKSDSVSLLINGDSNLIDKVKYEIKDGRLYLSNDNAYRFHSNNNLIIRLQLPVLNGVRTKAVGNVSINNAFTGDAFEIKLEGAGKFRADSLYVQSLDVRSEGIGSIELTGKANKAKFSVEGAGQINALELLSDSVFAQVDGIGSIKCNPVDYLKGNLNGVGKISYKEEPRMKVAVSMGVGKIGKE
jgi:phage shock protein PspC (stress-responsive transcriptional regulator)